MFRIAETIGSTVADLHSKLTVSEFDGWVKYFTNKPPDVQEIQMAVLMNMVASGLGAKNSKVDNYIISNHEAKGVKEEEKPKTLFDAFASIATPYKPKS